MAVHAPTLVTAELDLWVARDAVGDLENGVRSVVTDLDGVESVEAVEITDVTPRSTDIRVTVTVRLTITEQVADAEAAGHRLADGFGVLDATVLTVGETEA